MTNASRLMLLGLLLLPTSASAQECPVDHVGCHTEDVDFRYRAALFDDLMFDTGWQPAGSAVQVRFALFVGAGVEVEMGGTSVTSWPPALYESVPGRPGTGRFYFNYGIEVVARLRFDVRVAGIRYAWEGDIPIPGGVPRDLRLADEITFDPFVLPPSEPRPISATDMTGTVTLYDVPITDALIPIPGISGGFAVDAVAMLEGLYRTNTIEVNDAVGMIDTENGSVVVRADMGADGLGGAKDLVITPHGTITYEGMVTLMPVVYIEIAGRRFDIPIGDIPVPIPAVDSDTDFTPAEVHVPLPDIRVPTTVMFEPTRIGAVDTQLMTITNDGESTLDVEIRDPASPYGVGRTTISVPPRSSQPVELTFTPTLGDDRGGVLLLASNDPDEPLVTVRLNGSTFGDTPDGGIGGDAGPAGPTDGGCGCRTASKAPADEGSAAPLWFLCFGMGLVSRARRRRLRSGGGPPRCSPARSRSSFA